MPKSLARLRETAYKIPTGTVPITLTCGHTALYVRPLPAPGTDAFCRECGTWRRRKRSDKSGASSSRRPRTQSLRRDSGVHHLKPHRVTRVVTVVYVER